MAEQDNKVKEEWASEEKDQVEDELTSEEEEDQVEDELTPSNKGKNREDEHIDKDDHAEDKEGVVKATSFPKFMCLPAELRLMIWEFALPGPRTLRICPNPETDDEDEDDEEEEAGGSYYTPYERMKKKQDMWGFPSCCYAPEILNPGRFQNFPLAGVCQESREFIIDFGYETLYQGLMTVMGDRFQGPWFCEGRDEIEEYTDEMIIQISKGRRHGDWLYE